MRPDIVRQIRKEMCIQRRRSGSSLVRQKRRWTEHQHAKAGQKTEGDENPCEKMLFHKQTPNQNWK